MVALQREKLQREVDEGIGRLPASYSIRKIYYTYDPMMGDGEIKVSRAKLRRQLAAGTVRLMEQLPEQNVEREVAEDSEVKGIVRSVFADILQMPGTEIGGDAHFMNDLGGSSLDYYMLITQLEERFDVPIALESDHFRYSLNDFTRVIEDELSK